MTTLQKATQNIQRNWCRSGSLSFSLAQFSQQKNYYIFIITLLLVITLMLLHYYIIHYSLHQMCNNEINKTILSFELNNMQWNNKLTAQDIQYSLKTIKEANIPCKSTQTFWLRAKTMRKHNCNNSVLGAAETACVKRLWMLQKKKNKPSKWSISR